MLRVNGADFDVDSFLLISPWRNSADISRKGDSSISHKKPVIDYSGFGIDVGDPSEERLELQLAEIEKFLVSNAIEIARAIAFPGADEVEFEILLFWTENTAAYPLTLPPSFLQICGRSSVSVTLNVCAASDDPR